MNNKKITLATLKSFVNKNKGKLFINIKSSFDGMTDGCERRHEGFNVAKPETVFTYEHTLGIHGLWLVGSSRDYFTPYEDEDITGIDISNCCGRSIIGILK